MTQVLRGNIVHAPKMGELSILEHGYMVLEDGVIQGIYPVLPEALAAYYREKLGFYSCSVPLFDQYVLARFIDRGYFERHLNRLRRQNRNK